MYNNPEKLCEAWVVPPKENELPIIVWEVEQGPQKRVEGFLGRQSWHL